MPSFSAQSKGRLATCHDDLQALFNYVVKYYDCTILCGIRTTADQAKLYASGRTKPGIILTDKDGVTKKSRHQSGEAVDVAFYPINWQDLDEWYHFAGFVKGVASMLGINVTWGGDWDSDYDLHDQVFNDFPHWQIGA